MAITEDIRKAVTDPTPLYFLVGAGEAAVEQARKVPGIVEQIAAEAPGRIEAVRKTDPKAVQDKVVTRAKEAQATVQARATEVLGNLDKLGETVQNAALRGVGIAAEYAVKAQETYERVAEQGEQTVKAWRGEAAEEIAEIAVAVEPDPEPKAEPAPATEPATASAEDPAAKKAAPAKKTSTPRKTAAKKTEPAAE
ncbi:hypothetical protein ABT160_31465 [Streptomyces sp. NPDC001941]|uniref:hypothetical protein n=1 Tax=Streptomyces sp. NPDC001941 TaxID=3154659 RepID=UPI0033195674